jgi:predicted ATP-dependent serine protease
MFRSKPTPDHQKLNQLQKIYTKRINQTPFKISDLNKTVFQINGMPHVIIGMAPSGSLMLTNQHESKTYMIDSETILAGGNIKSKPSMQTIKNSEPINVTPVKMKSIKFDPSIFRAMKTGGPLDYMFSSKGGIMPATNYMIVGDPGIGKSTLTLDIISDIATKNTDIDGNPMKVLFISGEMTRIDMYDYVQRYPKFGDIDTIFLGEYLEQNPKLVIETIFNEGYDLILTDSFVEVQESVKESCNMTTKGAEKWLIDQMVTHNQGFNKLKKFTSFLMIQQVTKGGNFVGSNKLKHNTTGMMEIRYSNEFSGDRYIKFTKNRRGCEHDKLYFSLDKKDDVFYDLDRLQRDIDIKDRLSAEKDELMKEESLFDKLFNADEHKKAAEKLAIV